MDESRAWICQATADRDAGETLARSGDEGDRCQTIAKWQQSVEKAVKAIMTGLRDANLGGGDVGFRHEVEGFVFAFLRSFGKTKHRNIFSLIRSIFDQKTRADVQALDRLVPLRPAPGKLPRRNTEYPFQTQPGEWDFPANAGVFSNDEVARFRRTAHRICNGAGKVLAAIQRG